MATNSHKKRRSTFRLTEKIDFNADTITKIATARSKCGLIISNSADVPMWLSDDDLSKNITRRPKPGLFEESPLKGTFTDGFAMYSTFSDVENCSVRLTINGTGAQVLKSITNMFNQTTNGVKDFFIYYSGTGKSFNGDWMFHTEESDDSVSIIPLDRIVSKWKSRPNSNKNQYLLILSDTNYSGIWVSKARDRKLLRRENILVQSAVGRQEPSLEMTIGEIKPPCWITQIVCGKFTHNWLEICASPFYQTQNAVIDMKGSFVILDRTKVWDEKEAYFAETDHPMSNVIGPNEQRTMIGIPCYGYNIDHIEDEEEVEEEERKDDGDGNGKLKNGQVDQLQIGGKQRESGHLPKPSVRRLNLLQGVVGGMELKKHQKKKSRHVSTYSRGFVFSRVLKDIRHLVMGSDDEETEEEENSEWED